VQKKRRVPYRSHKEGSISLRFIGLPEGVPVKNPKDYGVAELKAIMAVLPNVQFIGMLYSPVK
jgi:hypothetical protein